MLDYYYEFRGWDKETGYPLRKRLKELEIEWVTKELESQGLVR